MTKTFHRFLQHTDDLPPDRRTHANVDGPNGYRWDGTLQELRQALLQDTDEPIAGGSVPFEAPKWEYDYISSGHNDYIIDFNKMGSEGWELVCCDFIGVAVFKRPK